MIKPESIDLVSLPWLPLEEKAAFPKRPSIYFAIDNLGNVQYIGRSVNTKKRWAQHHRYAALSSMGEVRIAYLFVDAPELLPEVEKALIQWFQPPLNYIDNPTNLTRLKTERTKAEQYKTSDIEMITVGHPDAELLKVFLHKQEKQALKDLAAKQGIPMYHLVRGMIIELLEQQSKSA